jgi:hypothetical protein
MQWRIKYLITIDNKTHKNSGFSECRVFSAGMKIVVKNSEKVL